MWSVSYLLICLCLLHVAADVGISSNLKYSVIIDAGSTGTRVYIYSFEKREPVVNITEVSNKKIGIGKFLWFVYILLFNKKNSSVESCL